MLERNVAHPSLEKKSIRWSHAELKAILGPDFASVSNRARQIKPILQDKRNMQNCHLRTVRTVSLVLKEDTEIEDAIMRTKKTSQTDTT